jgi:hypothetical protein
MIFISCGETPLYRQVGKSADSLVGVLSAGRAELLGIDTLSIAETLRQFNRNMVFMRDKVRDTLDAVQASSLRRYYDAGNNLQTFFVNRRELLGKLDITRSQLEKISSDARHKAGTAAQLRNHFATERDAAATLLSALHEQRTLFRESEKMLAENQPEVEELIKKNNSGQLPHIVTNN